MPNFTINCTISSQKDNRRKYLLNLHRNQTMHRILYIQKTKAVSLVTRIPCTVGNATLLATPNELHNGNQESGAN
jgi:hypothetical protein